MMSLCQLYGATELGVGPRSPAGWRRIGLLLTSAWASLLRQSRHLEVGQVLAQFGQGQA
jgi:hypothetical protein